MNNFDRIYYITIWDKFYRLGNNEDRQEVLWRIVMKIRTLAMTLIIVLSIWILAAPAMTGCGRELVSDSNTNSVENVRRGGENSSNAGGENVSIYIPMDKIKNEVVNILGENYWPDKRLTVAELKTETGITEEMYDDFLAEKVNIETDIDIMIILKAKAEYLAEIETMLNAYRDSLLVKYRDRPQELGKVQASRIEVIEPYICFVQLGADTEAAVKKGDEEVIALCQQENERAVDIIEKTILDQ